MCYSEHVCSLYAAFFAEHIPMLKFTLCVLEKKEQLMFYRRHYRYGVRKEEVLPKVCDPINFTSMLKISTNLELYCMWYNIIELRKDLKWKLKYKSI
jgi:hypothetical protein